MAGIGFELRKLAREDNLIGFVRAMGHSALASAGPWLFTILAIAFISIMAQYSIGRGEISEFRIIIIYNFAFSLAFSAPIFMVATRFLADSIYDKDVSDAPGLLIGSLTLLYLFHLPVVSYFYITLANLPLGQTLSAIANYMLITSIWLVSVFLTALKDYKTITNTFAIGTMITITIASVLGEYYGSTGLLNGFNIGLSSIMVSLIATILSEYPYPLKHAFKITQYLKKYWAIGLGGFIYNIAIWIDKWIMWFAPEAIRMDNGLISYPNYDSAMFLAYLSIVPAMTFFVFSVETGFFEKYVRFYRDIQRKANFKKIQSNHHSIIEAIAVGARNFLVLQTAVTFLVVLTAPKIFELLNINFLQLGIFRFGVLGALFHVLMLFLTILLSYFDARKHVVVIYLIFLISNACFTLYFMSLGFTYYGYGYFLASVFSFIIAAIITAAYVRDLPYHTFITNNTSIEKA